MAPQSLLYPGDVREQQESGKGIGFARDLALYTLARLAMVAVVIGILVSFKVPLLVAAVVSIIFVMPLSMLVLGTLRRRVAFGMAERTEARRQRRAELHAQLSGKRDEQG